MRPSSPAHTRRAIMAAATGIFVLIGVVMAYR
jgi:hypothetical protein